MNALQAITDIIRKDQFGILWFSLMFVAVLLGKWFLIESIDVGVGSCLFCVVVVLWLLALLFSILPMAVWLLWETKGGKSTSMVFVLVIMALASAVLFDVASEKIVTKLYHVGWIHWADTHVTYLLEDLVHHAAGLYLGCLVLYTGLRVTFSNSFADRGTVIPVALIFTGTASLLLFIGVVLY